MQHDPSIPTFLHLPDGSDLAMTDPKVRVFRVKYDEFPRFDIEGTRYRVESASEFAFNPRSGGPEWHYQLVEFGPQAN